MTRLQELRQDAVMLAAAIEDAYGKATVRERVMLDLIVDLAKLTRAAVVELARREDAMGEEGPPALPPEERPEPPAPPEKPRPDPAPVPAPPRPPAVYPGRAARQQPDDVRYPGKDTQS